MTRNVNELDFDKVKTNIIESLRSQTEFADYNFSGSGMTVFIDALSYATTYMGIYGNMTFNEMFLDSAELRSSVLSKALELGYIPFQTRSAIAEINITIDLSAETTPPQTILIPKGTKFLSTNTTNKSVTFTTISDTNLINDGNGILSAVISIYEGILVNETFTYSNITNNTVFRLSNKNVDISKLKVSVQHNLSDTTTEDWYYYDNITNIQSDTKAFFLKEIDDTIELSFGNGSIGKALLDGNLVHVEYLISKGLTGNNIRKFSLSAGFSSYQKNKFIISTTTDSVGGSDKESIQSIKHNAPLFYQTQNRLITRLDYESTLKSKFGYIEAINVWGGEDNTPKKYGFVLISIKPYNGLYLTSVQKNEILEYLSNTDKNIIVISHELVTPDYIYMDFNIDIKWDSTVSVLTESELKNKILTNISTYFADNIYKFSEDFRYADMLSVIDNSDKSIYSSFFTTILYKKFTPSYNSTFTYKIEFYNPIKTGSLSLKWDNANADKMEISDNNGDLVLIKNGSVINNSVGEVNYETGVINLIDFNPFLSSPTELKFYAGNTVYDIKSTNRNILINGANTINLSHYVE